jgi:hypothetical protein
MRAPPIRSPKTLVRMLGVPAQEAREICQRALPDLDALQRTSETAGQR